MTAPGSSSRGSCSLGRRGFLAGSLVGVAGGTLGWHCRQRWSGQVPRTQVAIAPPQEAAATGLPGRLRGRVVEVHEPGAVLPETRVLYYDGLTARSYQRRDPEAVARLLRLGMTKLVPEAETAEDAWRWFFSRGDRVGIKVVPVGRPDSISSFELVRAVIDGLASAGVRPQDVLVFERYRNEFLTCRYPHELPDRVHWECSSVQYDDAQLEIDGQIRGLPRVSHVSGYDRDQYRSYDFCQPEPIHHRDDDRRFRSHLSTIIAHKVDKFISLPVLKDHRSSGITVALKNLSHGSVNNVCRTHTFPSLGPGNRDGLNLNQCQTFIPGIAAMPTVRQKAVLQICDGLVGTYEGGPGNWNRTFATWNYNSLLLATDPVALDRVCWQIIDAKRAQMGWPSVAAMGQAHHGGAMPVAGWGRTEQLHSRQPQHVAVAATLGLGEFDPARITHERYQTRTA